MAHCPNGFLDDVDEAAGFTTDVGRGVALSFVAYIIGSLSEEATSAVGRSARRIGLPSDVAISLLEWAEIQFDEVRERVATTGGLRRPKEQDLSAALDLARIPKTLGTDSASDGAIAAFGALAEERRSAPAEAAVLIAAATSTDFERILLRLRDRPEIFSSIDRQRNEAELRWAVSLPLSLLGFVLAWRLLDAEWIAVVALAASLVIAAMLWRQGGERERLANTAIVDALRLNMVNAPAVERFERALQIVIGREAG